MSDENRLENALRGGAVGGAMGLGAHGLRRGGGALMREGASSNAMAAGKDLQSAAGLAPWFAPIAGGLAAKKKEEREEVPHTCNEMYTHVQMYKKHTKVGFFN